ncbi:MAG: hypothetical protein HYY50_03480 [Candidatus Kerfeldbacteria bacterium]|nr:hypothetical protein [Candidatus Kerfeldbacteria bacterium]
MTAVLQSNIPGQLSVWLVGSSQVVYQRRRSVPDHGAEALLVILDELLRRRRLTVERLKRIAVVRGPGPFSAVRTGLVVANTLSTVRQVPMTGVVVSQPLSRQMVRKIQSHPRRFRRQVVKPWYGREPNISRPT